MTLAAGQIIRAIDLASEAWQDLPLLNGWTARAGFFPPAFRMAAGGDSVELTGSAIKTPSGDPNQTVVARLPTGYRPASEVLLPLPMNSGWVGGISIRTNGDMALFYGSGFPTWTTYYLSGIFPLSR